MEFMPTLIGTGYLFRPKEICLTKVQVFRLYFLFNIFNEIATATTTKMSCKMLFTQYQSQFVVYRFDFFVVSHTL